MSDLSPEENDRLRSILAQLSSDDVKRLKEIIEADKWRERLIYMSRQCLIWVGLIGAAVAALKAMGVDILSGVAHSFRGPK